MNVTWKHISKLISAPKRHLLINFISIVPLLIFSACTKSPAKPTLWIYTSLYNHVVQEYDKKLKAKFPEINFKWYQSGSENVAAKVNSELLSGKTQADLLLTADIFWYEDLKERKVLLAYPTPSTQQVPDQFKDPAHYWATVRMPIMVIAYNKEAVSEQDAPKSFLELTHPKFKDKVAMPSPLESGTTFATVAQLSKKLGWEYFAKLRNNGIISVGGNSAVLSRIETKERPIGIVLWENVLAIRKRKNQKIEAILPNEGLIPIPCPIGITATTEHPDLAKKVYDYFFSKEGQEVILTGDHHAILKDIAPPKGTIPLSEVIDRSFPWSLEFISKTRIERESIKEQFSKLVLD